MRLISHEKTFTNTQNLRKKINKSVHSLRFNSFTTAQEEFDLPGPMTLTIIFDVSHPSHRLGPNYLESD